MIVMNVLTNRRVCCIPLQLYKWMWKWMENKEVKTWIHIVASGNNFYR